MRISVIINNYNYSRYLRESIDSALTQSYPDLEVIVVDDGSTDDSREIIASYKDKLIPILKENGGQASAFNAGFAHATGELVHFLDADDRLESNAAQIAVETYLKSPYGVLQAQMQVINADGKANGEYFPAGALGGDPVEQMRCYGIYAFPATSGNVFAASILRRLFPIPEAPFRLCADSYLCILVPFLAERKISCVPFAHYRIHGSNRYITNPGQSYEVKRIRDIQFVSNSIQKFRLIREASLAQGLKLSPFYFCGHMEIIFCWIFCRRIYGETFGDWPASDFKMLSFAAVAVLRGGKRRFVAHVAKFIHAVILTVMPRSVWMALHSQKLRSL